MPVCAWCGEELVLKPGSGMVHQDGHPYKGTCHCEGIRHPYSHDNDGRLVCKTWQDDHVVTPVSRAYPKESNSEGMV